MSSGIRFETPMMSIHDQGTGSNELKKMNAEQSGDRHPQPGGRRPDHVGEGAVGVLQEDADPREGPLDGGDGPARERAGDDDGQDYGHGPYGGEGQQDSGGCYGGDGVE